jgi:hypothetical protein
VFVVRVRAHSGILDHVVTDTSTQIGFDSLSSLQN